VNRKINRKALAPRQHTQSCRLSQASRAANLAASPRAEVFSLGHPSLVSSLPQLAGAGRREAIGLSLNLHCSATWHYDGARASFERLIIRFSEAVNRKAYILHNSPEIARACAAAQHV